MHRFMRTFDGAAVCCDKVERDPAAGTQQRVETDVGAERKTAVMPWMVQEAEERKKKKEEEKKVRQIRKAELERVAEEKRRFRREKKQEQERVAEEKRRARQQKKEEQERNAEEKRRARQQKKDEQERVAEEKRRMKQEGQEMQQRNGEERKRGVRATRRVSMQQTLASLVPAGEWGLIHALSAGQVATEAAAAVSTQGR
eukprot:gene36174-32546_t